MSNKTSVAIAAVAATVFASCGGGEGATCEFWEHCSSGLYCEKGKGADQGVCKNGESEYEDALKRLGQLQTDCKLSTPDGAFRGQKSYDENSVFGFAVYEAADQMPGGYFAGIKWCSPVLHAKTLLILNEQKERGFDGKVTVR